MADNSNEMRFTAVPDPASVCAVSDFFDSCVETYDIPLKTGYTVKVVADEIFSNIVYYSGANTAELLFRNDADRITLVFRDDGMPYNPLERKEPDITAGIEEREIGGLGLFMVKKLAEDVCYEYAQSKNQTTVVLSKTPKKKKLSLEDF